MATRVTLSGLDKLNRRLTQLPTQARKEIALAMEKGAQDIVDFAKTLAPVGQSSGVNSSNNPGALRDSIGWIWGSKPPKGSISLGSVVAGGNNVNRKDGDLVITIFAGNDKAFYARWVEFGTKSHGIDAKQAPTMGRAGASFGTHVDHPGAVAHPFFYPAYRAMQKRTKRRISNAVIKSVKKVASSG